MNRSALFPLSANIFQKAVLYYWVLYNFVFYKKNPKNLKSNCQSSIFSDFITKYYLFQQENLSAISLFILSSFERIAVFINHLPSYLRSKFVFFGDNSLDGTPFLKTALSLNTQLLMVLSLRILKKISPRLFIIITFKRKV